jgi:hypothetical protein
VCLVDDHQVARGALLVFAMALHQGVVRRDLDPTRVQLPDIALFDTVAARADLREHWQMTLKLCSPSATQDIVRRIDADAQILAGDDPSYERTHSRLAESHVIGQEHAATVYEAGENLLNRLELPGQRIELETTGLTFEIAFRTIEEAPPASIELKVVHHTSSSRRQPSSSTTTAAASPSRRA